MKLREESGVILSCLGSGIVIGTVASLNASLQDPAVAYIVVAILGAGAGQLIRAYADSDGDSS